jgi:hypothetical protein
VNDIFSNAAFATASPSSALVSAAGTFELARRGVELDQHIDRVAGRDARCGADLLVQAEQVLTSHRRDRRLPAVAVDRRAHGEAPLARGDLGDLVVIENDGGGGAAGDQCGRDPEFAHGLVILPFSASGSRPCDVDLTPRP